MSSGLTGIAKYLRKRSTDAERFLWKHLRTKQVEGLKFRRQEPIGKYIADFVCFEKKIVVEVDGGQHSEAVDSDRDEWLKSQGFDVLRFWNHTIFQNIEGVLEMIRERCLTGSSGKTPPTSVLPHSRGEDVKEGKEGATA